MLSSLRRFWSLTPRFALGVLVGLLLAAGILTQMGSIAGYFTGWLVLAGFGLFVGAVGVAHRLDLREAQYWRSLYQRTVTEATTASGADGRPAFDPDQVQVVMHASAADAHATPDGRIVLGAAEHPDDCPVCHGTNRCPAGEFAKTASPADFGLGPDAPEARDA